MTEPVEFEVDPTWVLGECDVVAGSVKMWSVPDSEIRY